MGGLEAGGMGTEVIRYGWGRMEGEDAGRDDFNGEAFRSDVEN